MRQRQPTIEEIKNADDALYQQIREIKHKNPNFSSEKGRKPARSSLDHPAYRLMQEPKLKPRSS